LYVIKNYLLKICTSGNRTSGDRTSGGPHVTILFGIWNLFVMIIKLMLGPCSGKKFDINFGNRLNSKEKGPGSPLLF
jgi:hypothetical protein